MRKSIILATAISLLLMIGITVYPHQTVYAADLKNVRSEESVALRLYELGIIMGTGTNEDGTVDFDLERAPTRVEMLVMLIRLLGKDSEAKAHSKTHPFLDVPEWADGYASYAYDNGLIKGVSGTSYDAQEPASAATYLTIVLRALGYSDGEGGDFAWDSPWALAAWCGILPPLVDRTVFLRADLISVTCAALYANVKGTRVALSDVLIMEGAFTAERFETAFPDDPLSEYRLMDSQIAEAALEHFPQGPVDGSDGNEYYMGFRIFTDIIEGDDMLTVVGILFHGRSTINKENLVGDLGFSSFYFLAGFDKGGLEMKYFSINLGVTTEEPDEDALFWEKYFSENTFEIEVGSVVNVVRIAMQLEIYFGNISYRAPSYEEALEREMTTESFLSIYVNERFETDYCTVLVRVIGGLPRGSQCAILLVYKPDSLVGEGEVISLPIPSDGFRYPKEPEEIWLSDDEQTLHYTYHFDEAVTTPGGPDGETITLVEAGTHIYSVDLATGEAAFVIEPLE